jgi:hypothetical protein
MAIFILDCEPVTATSSSISSIGSQVSQLSSSVSGYDTSCEDDFDFSSAARAISANIDACSTKIDNTSALITNVVDSHTLLQSSLLSGEDTSSSSNETDTSSSDIDNDNKDNNVTSSSTDSLTSDSLNTDTVIGAGTVIGASTVIGDATTNTDTNLNSNNETTTETPSEVISTEENEDNNSNVDISESVKKINYYSIDNENSGTYNYNDIGYAIYGDKYIVTCDESLGNIGDIITITKSDGTSIQCIIGGTTTGADSHVSFVVNSNNFDSNNTLINNIDTVKIINQGGGLNNFKDGIINTIEQVPNNTISTVSSNITALENESYGVDV